MKPLFSVIICTYNRSTFLADAIQSIRLQDYPDTHYEIVVVDNGSTDGTKELIKNLNRGQFNKITYILESKRGLSNARNAGASSSKFDIIVYVDDDILAVPNWLSELARAYNSCDKKVVCIGGGCIIRWEGERPHWLPKLLDGYLSGTEHLGGNPKLLNNYEYPVGANFSILKSAFIELGGFNPSLGRIKSNLLSGEEAELCNRIRDKGFEVLFWPSAIVYHRIPSERLKMQYLLKRSYWQGITDVIIEQDKLLADKKKLNLSTIVLFIQILQDLSKSLYQFIKRDIKMSFYYLFYAIGRIGRLRLQAKLIFQGKYV